ncbi:MAG: DUF3052 domain-containing protein, partial [Bacteroidota bacterium]
MPPSSGYSGTPLAKKLGIKPGNRLLVYGSPIPYWTFFPEIPAGVQLLPSSGAGEQADFIHIFAQTREELETSFQLALPRLKSSGMLWISWPKKSSSLATDLDKSQIRAYGLEQGLVDTKVAAVNADWSGHKF